MNLIPVVVQCPGLHHNTARVMHRAVPVDHPFLKGNGQIDGLEGGAGFIQVFHRPPTKMPGIGLPETAGVKAGL